MHINREALTMNTKTMRLPPRRVLTPGKRKEREGVISTQGVISTPTEKLPGIAVMKLPPPSNFSLEPVNSSSKKSLVAAVPDQHILAGYLSHEFLTNGTIFGEQWYPSRGQAGPSPAQSVGPNRLKPIHTIEASDQIEAKRKRYAEVANLLRVDGAHFPGVVNPAQLARFLKL